MKETKAVNGVAEFYYLKPEKYYLRLIVDRNNNGNGILVITIKTSRQKRCITILRS